MAPRVRRLSGGGVGASGSPWEQQVRQDADALLRHMQTAVRADPGRTFSVARLVNQLGMPRGRVTGALALLVFVDKTMGVTHERADQARFYPLPGNAR